MRYTMEDFTTDEWIVVMRATQARDKVLKKYGESVNKTVSNMLYTISELVHVYKRAGMLTDRQVTHLNKLTTKIEAKL